jgi:hypothetical protein
LLKTDPAAAKKVLEGLLVAKPDSCARELLLNLAKKEPAHSKKEARTRVEDAIATWSKFLAILTIPVLAALALAALLLSAATRSRRLRSQLRRLPGLRGWLRPRIAVGSFGDPLIPALGEGTSALLSAALSRMHGEPGQGDYNLDLSSGTEKAGATVALLGDVAPQFKAFAAILGFATRAAVLPRYKLTGSLHAPSGRGDAVTLAVSRSASDVASTTLWRQRPPPVRKRARPASTALTDDARVDAFQQLALVAAGWADFIVRSSEAVLDVEWETTAPSFAFFRLGVGYELDGSDDLARSAYEVSLRIDATNVGALVNLGRLYERQRQHVKAQRLLEAALLALA